MMTPKHGPYHGLAGRRPHPGKQVAGHGRARGQIGLMRELESAGPRIVTGIVAGIAQRQATPAGAGLDGHIIAAL